MPADAPADVPAAMVAFARTLRAAGVDASTDRVATAVDALTVLDPAATTDVYWAGRLAMCASRDDVDRYDRVFAAVFGGGRLRRYGADEPFSVTLAAVAALDDGAVEVGDDGVRREPQPAAASRLDLLRRRDLAELDDADRRAALKLLDGLALTASSRRTRRTAPAGRGRVDPHRTLRRILDAGGEPVPPARQRPRKRPRRIVFLVDVSGSMATYADAMLRFAHAARRGRGPAAEVFTFGTRLTRVTREMQHRDPRLAMAGVAAAIPDWSGGTRLGELMKEFLDRWGQRGTARGAVVVVMSDGWERGDVTLLGEQMRRLRRLAHTVIWVNPRAGRTGFTPTAAGMAAALPYVDTLVPGHSVEALQMLAKHA